MRFSPHLVQRASLRSGFLSVSEQGGRGREWRALPGAPQALQSLEGQFRGATRRAHSFGLPIVFAGMPFSPAPFPPLFSGGPYHSHTDNHRKIRAAKSS